MATTADYLNKLISQKNALADNLVTKGVAATHDETLETLVPKILEISGGSKPVGYISDGLIMFSELSNPFPFNVVFDEKVNRMVHNCNGTKGYIIDTDTDIAGQLADEFTLQAMCRTSVSNRWGEIFGVLYESPYQAVSLGVNTNGYFAVSYSGSNISDTTVKINDDEWHMLTATYKNDVLKMYVDGVNVLDYNHNFSISPNAAIYLGQWINNVSRYIGNIANICIYKRALSDNEVLFNKKIWINATDTSNMLNSYISDGLIAYSNLDNNMYNNPISDDVLNRIVNHCTGAGAGANVVPNVDIASQLAEEFTFQILCRTTTTGNYGIFGCVYPTAFNAAMMKIENGCFGVERAHGNFMTETVINDDKWHMLSITYSDGLMKLYVDGVNVMDYSAVWAITENAKICIGEWVDGTGWLFGYIANACIYNRCLSDSEILQNWNADVSRYGIG